MGIFDLNGCKTERRVKKTGGHLGMCSCGAFFICRSGFHTRWKNPDTSLSNTPAAKIPQISHRAMNRDSIPLPSTYLRKSGGAGRRVIWITRTTGTRRICPASASQHRTACLAAVRPVNMEPSTECAHTGGRDFSLSLSPSTLRLTYFYFDALENPQTFFFHRHTLPPARLLFPFRRLDERGPPRGVGCGLSSAPIIQRLCTSMRCGQRSCSGVLPCRLSPLVWRGETGELPRPRSNSSSSGSACGGVATCAAPPTNEIWRVIHATRRKRSATK